MEDKQFRIFIDDPIFRRLHLPYPPQEKAKLKRQIIQEGYTKPFLTWSGVLLADFDAYDIFEKTPENMELITPMSGGRIQNVLMMEAVLHLLLRKPCDILSVHLDLPRRNFSRR